jgi:hypothetical protein
MDACKRWWAARMRWAEDHNLSVPLLLEWMEDDASLGRGDHEVADLGPLPDLPSIEDQRKNGSAPMDASVPEMPSRNGDGASRTWVPDSPKDRLHGPPGVEFS